MLSDFVEYLQKERKPIHFGVIGYMNTIRHILDFRRSCSAIAKKNTSIFVPYEIYIQRSKRFLSKKINVFWKKVISVDYLESITGWTGLKNLQKVISFHSNRYKQIYFLLIILIICKYIKHVCNVFCCCRFLLVKVYRPMLYHYLTVQMNQSVRENGTTTKLFLKLKKSTDLIHWHFLLKF